MANPFLYVEYGGSGVSNAFNVFISTIINGKDTAYFSIPNYKMSAWDTWKNREDCEVSIYQDIDGTPTRRFQGQISKITPTNPMLIELIGYIDRMTWDALTEIESQFVLDKGKLSAAPVGDPAEELKCVDEEDTDLGWSNDDYNGKYMIIDDNTFGNTTVTPVRIVGIDTDDYKGTQTNTFAKTFADDEDFWVLNHQTISGAQDHSDSKMFALLDFNDEDINSDNLISRIKIKINGKIKGYGTGAAYTYYVAIAWAKTVDDNLAEMRPIRHYTVSCPNGYWSEIPIGIEEDLWGEWEQHITGWNINRFLLDEGGEWRGGYLMFWVKPVLQPNNVNVDIYIDEVSLEFDYETGTFDRINCKIKDTVQHAGYDSIYLCDGEGAEGCDGNLDVQDNKIAANDIFMITENMNHAFNQCNKNVGIYVNDGNDIDKGIGTDYFGINAYRLFTDLCTRMNYFYTTVYHNVNDGLIIAKSINDLGAAAVTYSRTNDPPSWAYNVGLENEIYSGCYVFYKDGMVGPFEADTPNTDYTISKIKPLVQKGILTKGTAIDFGQGWINENNKKQYSIHLHWDYLPDDVPVVGTLYNFDDILGNSFDEQICRRVSVFQNGGLGKFVIDAYFGTGLTPPEESIGKAIGDLERVNDINKAIELTTSSITSNRHTALLGVTAGQHHTKYTDVEVLALIDAEIVGGQSIDNAIDALILTHKNDEDAHHMEMDDLTDIDTGLATVTKSLETVGSGEYPAAPVEGQIYWDADDCILARWNVVADAWIEIGGGAGLVGGNSAFLALIGGTMTGNLIVEGSINAYSGNSIFAYNADESDYIRILHDANYGYLYSDSHEIHIVPKGVTAVEIDSTEVSFNTDVKIMNGDRIIIYSAGNDKYIEIKHTDAAARIINTVGNTELLVATGSSVYVADTGWLNWEDIHADNFVNESEPLEDKKYNISNYKFIGDNWKESFDEDLLKRVPEEMKGNKLFPAHVGVKINKIAFLALKKCQLLEQRIKDLESRL